MKMWLWAALGLGAGGAAYLWYRIRGGQADQDRFGNGELYIDVDLDAAPLVAVGGYRAVTTGNDPGAITAPPERR